LLHNWGTITMLDQETKKRIDDCRNILVGKVPDPKSQVEQITIAMIYKFMYDMDLESIEMGGIATYFVGEYERYSWKNIFNPRIGGNEMITLYGEGIVKMNLNPNIPQLFRDIFKNAYLPYRDPETLKLFLKGINEFHYSHSEKLGDAFEYLLSVLGSQGDAGQFRTPRHIIDFMVELLQPKKTDRILDPACGTSGFLISSYKHILRKNTKKNLGDLITVDERNQMVENISGYDISPDMVRLSLVNLYLHNFSNPKIYEYDSLTSEDRWNEYYDVILANPPFMSPKGGIKPHKRFSIESNRAEVLFVDYIMEHLTPKGRSGIVVPEGIIFQSGIAYKSLRKLLVEKYLVGVISLPSGVFQPYSGVKTSILILDKELSQKTDKIFFGKVYNDGFDLGAQRREINKNDLPILTKEVTEYLDGLRQGIFSESEKLTYVAKEQIIGSSDIGLSYERYSNNEISSTEYNLVKLESITSLITKGTTPTSVGFNFVNEGINFVKIESITNNGNIIKEKFDFITKECHESLKRSILEENDILFSIAGALGRTYVVEKNILPSNTNQALSIIRLNKHINPYYVSYILRSNVIKKKILGLKVGVAQMNISLEQVRNIEIPLPPIEVQVEIVRELEQYQKIIDGAKQVVDNYKPIIDIDPSWEMKELGEVVEVNPKKSEVKSIDEETKVSFVPMSDVNENEIFFLPVGIKKINEVFSGYTYFRDNDVLLAKVTPCFENGKGGICRNLINGIGFGSSEYYVLRPSVRVLSTWVYVFVTTDKFRKQGVLRMTGTGGLQRVPKDFVESYEIPVPPLEIQQSIVERIENERQIIEGNKKLIEIYTQKIQDRINKIWGE
jgi:type I restriction enzyme M protein